MSPNTPRTLLRIGFIAAIVLAVCAVVGAVIYAVTRPTMADFTAARKHQVTQVATADEKLVPAFNAYLSAFKQAQNQTDSIEKAKEAAAKEQKAYQDAVAKADQAAKALQKNRASNDSDVGVAVRQYVQASQELRDYYSSLLNGYDEYSAIFTSKEKLCSDVLVGATANLAERRDKLQQAVKDCYPALARLKESGNITYIEYATTLENAIKNLEKYSVAVAKGESDYKKFEAQQQELQAKAAALSASGSKEEYEKLQGQIEDLNDKISQSQSDFTSAASHYKSTVDELPKLYGAVYSESVPKQLKTLNSLVDVRKKVLVAVLDDKLLTNK